MRRNSGWWIGSGFILSVLLHVVVIAPLMLGWVELGKQPPPDKAVVVELVVLEMPAPREEPIAESLPGPEAEKPPEPEPAQAVEVEPVMEPQEVPEAEPETAEAPAPEPELAEAPEAEPVPEPAEPELVEELPEAPMPQPEPAEAPAPLQEQAVASAPSTLPEPEPSVALPPRPPRKPVLAELSPEPPAEARPAETNTAQPATPPASDYRTTKEIAEVSREQLLANLAVARDEAVQAEANPELWRVIRAVRRQVEGCWLISPAEARNPKLSVDIDVAFDRGGQVTKAQVREIGRMVVDDEFEAFATTAHGALKACGPFKLPPESYAIWRSFTMRFVPRQRS